MADTLADLVAPEGLAGRYDCADRPFAQSPAGQPLAQATWPSANKPGKTLGVYVATRDHCRENTVFDQHLAA